MMESIDNLVRENIRNLIPYTSAREQFMDYGMTLLDANENSLGTIGLTENPWLLHRYPDPYQRALKEQLSQLKGHPLNGIVLGNGSDEIIDLLIRTFCEPGIDEVLVTDPSYGMYQVSAHINDVGVKKVSLDSNFDLDLPSVLEVINPATKIIFLCSPNNPTANLLSESRIAQLADDFSGILVIDEAYIDFASQESLIKWCRQRPRLVVMQTFSKAWGLAGIRLGACYTSPHIAKYLNKVKPPYNVNQLTQQQAIKALDHGGQLPTTVEQILQQRAHLSRDLQEIDLVQKVYPSDTNFLLVRITKAPEVFAYLIEQNVIVRNRSQVHLCEDCLRITVGTVEENQLLIRALKSYKV